MSSRPQEFAGQLKRFRHQDQRRPQKIQPVVVHMSSPADGDASMKQYQLNGVINISDPDCVLYRAYQLPRGRWRLLFCKAVFRTKLSRSCVIRAASDALLPLDCAIWSTLWRYRRFMLHRLETTEVSPVRILYPAFQHCIIGQDEGMF